MSGWEDDLEDPFLAELSVQDTAALSEALVEGAAPPPSLRDRIMAAASLEGRFERYVATTARLLDVDEDRARGLLDGIGRGEVWYQGLLPDVSLYDIEGGPAVENAITGFIRMPAGTPFPEHDHLGKESALILQGSAEDHRGVIWRPGEVIVLEAGQVHSFRARPGPDLVYLVVVQNGIKIGDQTFGPDDPRV
ncbi:MAG: cupin domain-containing protein [Myxococcales bacterium]|nr:cupin domain-containing protein [Myxococcales bacterium]